MQNKHMNQMQNMQKKNVHEARTCQVKEIDRK